MFYQLHSRYPDEDGNRLSALAEIWSIELGRIIERMLEISMSDCAVLPPQVRHEAIFELAKLVLHLEEKIIEKKISSASISQIDPESERKNLESSAVQERVENTAGILAERIWMRLQNEWWERYPALVNSRPPQGKHMVDRAEGSGARRHHFSPASSNKRWAIESGKVRVYFRAVDGTIAYKDKPARAWGRETFLYSQRLERLLSLVEGDVGGVYKKLLDMIPLSENDRRHWVAFLASQIFRTPAFILRHLPSLRRVIERRGLGYPTDIASLRRVYETIFEDSRIFATMYRLIVGRRWEMWLSPDGTDFIRSDIPVLAGSVVGTRDWSLVYPMTPTRCFVARPVKSGALPDVVPSLRHLTNAESATINRLIASSARQSVLARIRGDDEDLRLLLNESLGKDWDDIRFFTSIAPEYWGDIG